LAFERENTREKKKNYVFFQPTEENKKNMIKFFNQVTKLPGHPITPVLEPRGKWAKEEIKKFCKELDLIYCVDPFKNRPIYDKINPVNNIYGINYFRLHGPYSGSRINYNYQYTNEKLKKLFYLCDKKVNYCLFNNLKMYEDALSFQKVVTDVRR